MASTGKVEAPVPAEITTETTTETTTAAPVAAPVAVAAAAGSPKSPPGRAATKSPSKSPPRSPPGGQWGDDEIIEAADPDEPVDADEFSISNYDPSTGSVASTSVTSSVYNFSFENGRRYHTFKNAKYPVPNDDAEQSREDLKHALIQELTGGRIFLAPITDNPQRIIDLGTGSGIWPVEMADLYPGAEVIGVDMSPIQPVWVPPNLKFIVDNIEEEWLHGDNFDFAHLRHMAVVIADISKVIKDCYDHLKPGGWIEFDELAGYAYCDDGTMPENYQVSEFLEVTAKALGKFGLDFRAGTKLQPLLEDAGFVNVTCHKYKVPVGPWAKDKTMRLAGMYTQQFFGDLLNVMGAKPFPALGMSPQEIEVFLAGVRRDMRNDRIHAYFNYVFWVGQKPETSS